MTRNVRLLLAVAIALAGCSRQAAVVPDAEDEVASPHKPGDHLRLAEGEEARLVAALADPDARFFAACRLGAAEKVGPEAVRALTAQLADKDAGVRAASAVAVGRFAAEEAVPKLVPLLHDPDADVRREAARALGRLGGGVSSPALAAALRDKDEDVRKAAIDSLGHIGPPAKGAVAALRQAMDTSDPDIRSRIAASLKRIERP